MNMLCWNCRGLGTDATVGELRWLVCKHRPSLLFLSETKMRDKRARNFMWSLGYSGAFAVSSNGLSGGLALFWSSSLKVSLRAFSTQLIDILVTPEERLEWRSTLVYGEPKKELRHLFWDRMRFLRTHWRGPWICAGDFNEALSNDEQIGGRIREENQMALFRDCLDDCGLMDLGYIGPKFTWSNKQGNNRNIKVRLDRAVANSDFMQIYDSCTVENIITSSSDHYAILVNVASASHHIADHPIQHSFKFEAAWMRAPDYSEMVEEAWTKYTDGAPSLNNTWSALKSMSNTLQTWSKQFIGSIRKEIKKWGKKVDCS
jgi:hypothetical protein